jgi:putative chitinase
MAVQELSNVLINFIPDANKGIITAVDYYFQQYAGNFKVDTDKRVAAFFAQAAEETAGFKTLKEYWGPTAQQKRYEGRKDLGNTVKGDGEKFKGRGIFQITGRSNYQKTSQKLFGDNRLLDNPEILEQPEWAVLSALHYWNDKSLNTYADSGNFKALTKAINGGTNGLTQRTSYWTVLTKMLTLSPVSLATMALKKKPSNNGGGFGSALSFFLFGH